jgi:hypothetical protein
MNLDRIHAGDGFVEKQQLGFGGERTGDFQAPLIRQRQFPGQHFALRREADALEQFIEENKRTPWNVRTTPRRAMLSGREPETSTPSTMMRPSVGGSTPVIRLNSVVLPAPLGPMMEWIVPR